jgi:hypothetical protein
VMPAGVGFDEAPDRRLTSLRPAGAVNASCGSTAITTRSLGSAPVACHVPPLDEDE